MPIMVQRILGGGSSWCNEHLDRRGERGPLSLHAGSVGGEVTFQAAGTAEDAVDSFSNGNAAINEIFSPPSFISYDSRELALEQGNSVAHIFSVVREMMFSNDLSVTHFERFALHVTVLHCTFTSLRFLKAVSMYSVLLRKFLPGATALNKLLVCKSRYQCQSIFT